MSIKRILYLTVSKQWFDKYLSGEKTADYRECSDYWNSILMPKDREIDIDANYLPVKFDCVEIRNGYGKKRPGLVFEHKATDIVLSKGTDLITESDVVFEIQMGKLISKHNIK